MIFRGLCALALGLMLYGQDQPKRLTFEVASIKPVKPAPSSAAL